MNHKYDTLGKTLNPMKKITQSNKIFHLSQITSIFLPYGSTWEEVYIGSGIDLMCGKQKATVFSDTQFTDASMRHGTNQILIYLV